MANDSSGAFGAGPVVGPSAAVAVLVTVPRDVVTDAVVLVTGGALVSGWGRASSGAVTTWVVVFAIEVVAEAAYGICRDRLFCLGFGAMGAVADAMGASA